MSKKDPLASLINYIGTVKPYHTKVYEVIHDYVHKEPIKASVTEKYQISVLMTTPEANKWFIVPGIGWDTGPFDMDQNQEAVDLDGRGARNWGPWDYPQTSNSISPSRVVANVQETLKVMTEMTARDQIHTYADMHSLGWDVMLWDSTGFDERPPDTKLHVEHTDSESDPVGAVITDTISFEIT